MLVYSEIVEKYIDVMRSSPYLKEVSAYHFGAPTTIHQYPLIYVQWLGREYSGRSDLHRFQYSLEDRLRQPDPRILFRAGVTG